MALVTPNGAPPRTNPLQPLQREFQACRLACPARRRSGPFLALFSALLLTPPHPPSITPSFEQAFLDKSTPHVKYRWAAWVAVLLVYALRVTLIQGFYIVTYAMAIYNLNLLLGFLTPLHVEADQEGPVLPSKSDEEFRPFVRRLPEFKFW